MIVLHRLLFLAAPGAALAVLWVWWRAAWGFDAARPDHWLWLWRWFAAGGLPAGMDRSFAAAGGVFVAAFAFAAWLAGRIGARTVAGEHGEGTLHGSARWARRADAAAAGLFGRSGVVVGGWRRGLGRRPRPLRHDGPEHAMAFAPTRSGKGVSLVVPTLLEWRESALVLDIKGENHALTAGWRASAGQRILKFDPTSASGSARFNPLAEVRLGDDRAIADAQNVAAMIIDPDGKGLQDFWMKSGFAWLTAGILHVLHRARDREGRTATLTDVARHLSAPGVGVEAMLSDMLEYDHGAEAVDALVRQAAQAMLDRAPAERSGVHSSALTELDLYRDPVVAKNIAGSDFSVDDLVNGDAPATLYLVVPPSDIDRLRPLMRVMLNLFLRRLTGSAEAPRRHRLLLMLDEFTSIGKLEIFERALAFMAGYGLKCFIVVQDLAQLRKAYGRDESVMANCHLRIAFAPNSVDTAKALSDMTGKTTVVQKRRSRSRKAYEASGNLSESLAATGRPLMTPDECMTLRGIAKDRRGRAVAGGDTLVFPAGYPPIRGRQVLFFQDREWLRRSRIPPPSDGDGAGTAPDGTTGKETPATPAVPDLPRYADILAATEAAAGADRGKEAA